MGGREKGGSGSKGRRLEDLWKDDRRFVRVRSSFRVGTS